MAPCDAECYQKDKAHFIASLRESALDNEAVRRSKANAYFWNTVGALASGLGGGLTALVVPGDNAKKNIGTAAGLLAGAFTTVLTTFKYEAASKAAEDCVALINRSRNLFDAQWDVGRLPSSQDDPRADDYTADKARIRSSLNEVCTR